MLSDTRPHHIAAPTRLCVTNARLRNTRRSTAGDDAVRSRAMNSASATTASAHDAECGRDERAAAEALQRARGDERLVARRDRAEQRRDAEEHRTGEKHA